MILREWGEKQNPANKAYFVASLLWLVLLSSGCSQQRQPATSSRGQICPGRSLTPQMMSLSSSIRSLSLALKIILSQPGSAKPAGDQTANITQPRITTCLPAHLSMLLPTG